MREREKSCARLRHGQDWADIQKVLHPFRTHHVTSAASFPSMGHEKWQPTCKVAICSNTFHRFVGGARDLIIELSHHRKSILLAGNPAVLSVGRFYDGIRPPPVSLPGPGIRPNLGAKP